MVLLMGLKVKKYKENKVNSQVIRKLMRKPRHTGLNAELES